MFGSLFEVVRKVPPHSVLPSEPDRLARRAGMSSSQDLLRDLESYYAAFSAVARVQRMQDPRLLQSISFRKHFWLTAEDVARWNEVFGASGKGHVVPYTYHAPLAATGLNRIIREAGLNLRNVLHLRNTIAYGPSWQAELQVGRRYTVEGAFDGLGMVSEHHAVLRVSWEVRTVQGHVGYQGKDYFIVRGVDGPDRERLRRQGGSCVSRDIHLRDFAAPSSALQAGPHAVQMLEFPEDLGLRYGRVSGQINLVNTNRQLTRFLGYPRPVAQGQCIANQVIFALTANGRRRLRTLDLRYCRPVYLGQSVPLHIGSGAVEIVDAQGQILVWGTWT